MRTINLTTVFVISLFLMGMVSTATGEILYVDEDGPADYKRIQDAINVAKDGDTIVVKDGIYSGPGLR